MDPHDSDPYKYVPPSELSWTPWTPQRNMVEELFNPDLQLGHSLEPSQYNPDLQFGHSLEPIPENLTNPGDLVNLDLCALCYANHTWQDCPVTYTPCPSCGWIGTHRFDCNQPIIEPPTLCSHCGMAHEPVDMCPYLPSSKVEYLASILWNEKGEEIVCKKCGCTPSTYVWDVLSV